MWLGLLDKTLGLINTHLTHPREHATVGEDGASAIVCTIIQSSAPESRPHAPREWRASQMR